MLLAVPKADAYGGVVFDETGRVLLREPKNHFGGYAWTFAKGRPDKQVTPEAAALREVREETGYAADICGVIPTAFAGTTTTTVFFVMRAKGAPSKFDDETSAVRWVDAAGARKLIAQSTSASGRNRDLAVLAAAFAIWNAP